jgi:hypothetical protein
MHTKGGMIQRFSKGGKISRSPIFVCCYLFYVMG